MDPLLENIEFWKVIASMAWPAAILVIFFVLRGQIRRIFDREEMDIEVAGFKIHVRDATKRLGRDLTGLMDRVATIEAKRDEPANSPETRFQSHRFSILWVDDFPSNNAFLIEKFRADGVEVEISTSTEEALQKLRQRDFDVLISDLGRIENGRDNPFAGLDLLQRLSSVGLPTPSLVYAGRRGLENERKLKEAGAELVTSSPIEVIAFVEHHRRMRPA
jgi:CheY-like chemotaxis protein